MNGWHSLTYEFGEVFPFDRTTSRFPLRCRNVFDATEIIPLPSSVSGEEKRGFIARVFNTFLPCTFEGGLGGLVVGTSIRRTNVYYCLKCLKHREETRCLPASFVLIYNTNTNKACLYNIESMIG